MKRIADTLFLAELIYFVCMAIAHYTGFKAPVLFIYYDVPFHSYQDKIISFAVCAYIGLFFEAWRNPSVRNTAIAVMYLTVLGLASVKLSEDLTSLMTPEQSTTPYWIQTIAILVSTLALHITHLKSKRI